MELESLLCIFIIALKEKPKETKTVPVWACIGSSSLSCNWSLQAKFSLGRTLVLSSKTAG